MRLMPEMPDYRTEPSASPEGDAVAANRWAAWTRDNLDPIVRAEPDEQRYGWDQLGPADVDGMASRVVTESEMIGFWVAWHRAGGFAGLERGGWDRSTIFRKVRRFRSYFGIHPDNARFPWMRVDWQQCWESDRLVAMNWATHTTRDHDCGHGAETDRWQPCWAPVRPDPHDLEAADAWTDAANQQGRPGPIEKALRQRQRPASRR
jgi:hypothetical protein